MTGAPEGYDDQIVLRRDGVYIAGTRIPAAVHNCITIRTDEIPGHWNVDITLLTGVEPVVDDLEVVVREHHSTATEKSTTYQTSDYPGGICDP